MPEENENIGNGQKPTIGRKLSRVLSIFRKNGKSPESEINEDKTMEPLYEELIYGDISSPQNFVFTNKYKYESSTPTKISELTEILRLGKPFPQVVECCGWRATGFKHRSPILFLNEGIVLP